MSFDFIPLIMQKKKKKKPFEAITLIRCDDSFNMLDFKVTQLNINCCHPKVHTEAKQKPRESFNIQHGLFQL